MGGGSDPNSDRKGGANGSAVASASTRMGVEALRVPGGTVFAGPSLGVGVRIGGLVGFILRLS